MTDQANLTDVEGKDMVQGSARNNLSTSGAGAAEPRSAGLDAEGWRPLSELPGNGEQVEGLLSDGHTTEAEWWGPVPEALWDAKGDGSGWAYSATGFLSPEWDNGVTLIGWRPYAPGLAPKSPEPPW